MQYIEILAFHSENYAQPTVLIKCGSFDVKTLYCSQYALTQSNAYFVYTILNISGRTLFKTPRLSYQAKTVNAVI
jgi:hypothetical protein